MEKQKSTNLVFLLISIVTILIWALSGLAIYYWGSSWTERGTFGDMFGAVNALFSGLAFAAFAFAIYMQREDLKVHKEELKLQRQELKKNTQTQIKSEKALEKQTEQMHLTAKLNAMNTIINYYNTQITNPASSTETIEKARQNRKKLIFMVQALIDEFHDSEIE